MNAISSIGVLGFAALILIGMYVTINHGMVPLVDELITSSDNGELDSGQLIWGIIWTIGYIVACLFIFGLFWAVCLGFSCSVSKLE